MAYSGVRELIIENRHTGERLAMRRVKRGDEVWLELKASLPAHRQGAPLHIHVAEDEEGVVRSGTLSAVLNGRRFTAGSGERVSLPRGSAHRWERRERASCVRRLCAARSGLGPTSSSDLRSPQRRLGEPASALLHGPSPLTASSYADLSDHAAADSSRAVSSDRHGWHPAWALSRRGLARVSISLSGCAVRCRRSHVTRRSKALLMRVTAPTWALDVLIARTGQADRK